MKHAGKRHLFDDGMHEQLSCKSKNRYETFWQAHVVANEQMERHPGLKLHIYECDYCSGWHLASECK